jgi:hypothetical protein
MIGIDDVNTQLSESGDEAGESRRKRLSRSIVRNNVSGVYGPGVVTGIARIRVPSVRLRVLVGLSFRPNSGPPDPLNTTGWTGTLDAVVKFGEQGGFYLPSNSVIPGPAALSTTLPWSYETQTMVDQLLVTVTVPNLPGTNSPEGDLWVVAAWEPWSSAIIGDGELKGIFRQCSMDVEQAIVSTTGA